jgi:T4 RnlA family RNA ligase
MEHLLTYEDCLKLVDTYKNFNFYRTDFMIGGFKVSTFNYFLCYYSYFIHPIESEPEITGMDCRGITFVFNKDGSLYKRFFMLKKFFNLNQVEETQYSIVKNKKIKNITSKEDGSLIAFMNLPNEKVFAKTQGGFDNDQLLAAMKLYNENQDLQVFIKTFLFNRNETPLFEYVSFDNRIVLQYSKSELRFIGVRNNLTGKYKSASHWSNKKEYFSNMPNIPKYVKSFNNVTLDELIELAKIEKDKEGWVVEFEDNQMIKIKTLWYLNMHYLRTESVFREDYIIEHYLKQTLDDVMSVLDPDKDKDAFDFVEKIQNAVKNWSNFIEDKVVDLVNTYKEKYKENFNEFAKVENKASFFNLSKNKIEIPDEYNKRKVEYMLKMTYRLNEARNIINKWSKI